MELYAFAEIEADCLTVGRNVPRLCKDWPNLQIRAYEHETLEHHGANSVTKHIQGRAMWVEGFKVA
jgi:hypothetical protein